MNIFLYTDLQSYLNEYFSEKKRTSTAFSHRYLCGKLGLKSANHMLLVMQGKRNLTHEIGTRLSRFMRHTKQEAEYFEYLVQFSQAKNQQSKQRFWEKMMELRQVCSVATIESSQYEYYREWYHVVVRELITALPPPINYKKLAKTLSPPITARQVRQSVALLQRIGLIWREGERYRKQSAVVQTENRVNSLAIYNFHLKMAHLAIEKLQTCERSKRNFSSCTMELSAKGLQRVVEQTNQFRKELMRISEQDANDASVYHINVQLFPISNSYWKGQ